MLTIQILIILMVVVYEIRLWNLHLRLKKLEKK